MAARMEDEDDDSFVTIGAAFDIPDEETSTKKKFDKHEQLAVDSRGRRRFHGAFTGGFSAGYFNSVGTKEGWSPSTFKSSRSSRGEKKNSSQRPEDFMDDEDFGEYGIAPKTFMTKDDFTPIEKELDQRKRTIGQAVREGVIRSAVPGGIPLDELILPSKFSMGIQLLRKMGWKEGHGVGDKFKSVETGSMQPDKKVYGCSLPTNENMDTDISISNMQLLLAPKDVQPIDFTPKDNQHGIGYSGIDPASGMFLGAGSLAETFKPTGSEKRGIKGQAFGVGALEDDDDDDIYSRDDMSDYDFAMTSEREKFYKANHGWSGPPKKDKIKGTIPGFKKASRPTSINKVFRPPLLPANFNAMHKLSDTYSSQASTKPRPDLKDSRHFLSSNDRAVILGEKMPKKPCESVFEIISEEDKLRMTHVKANDKFRNKTEPKLGTIEPEVPRKPSRWDNRSKTSISFVGSGGASEKSAFKPFTSNPEKQERYDNFMAAKKLGKEANLQYDSSMTEWEKEREKEEFARASILFRPMSTSIASRFTRATYPIDSGEDDKKKTDDQEDIPDCKKAAAMGLFGKLTRQTMEWHPSSILCKRFNIPDPYPESRMTGVPGRQRKKVSDWVPEMPMEASQKVSVDSIEDRTFSEPDTSDGGGDVKRQQGQEDEDVMPLKEPIIRSQKPSITIGPLSCLNNTSNSNDRKVSFSAKNQTEDNKQGDDLVKKPSMDLFKAIFADSDSNSEDEVDTNEKDEKDTKKDLQKDKVDTPKLEETFVEQKVQNQTSLSFTGSSSVDLGKLGTAKNSSIKFSLSGEDKTLAPRNMGWNKMQKTGKELKDSEGNERVEFERRVVDKPQTQAFKASSKHDDADLRSYGPALPGTHLSRTEEDDDRYPDRYSHEYSSKNFIKGRDIDASDDSVRIDKASDFRYKEGSDPMRVDGIKRRDFDEQELKSDKSRSKKKEKKKHKKNKKKKHKKHSQKKEKTKRHLSEESSSSEWTDSDNEHLRITKNKDKEPDAERHRSKGSKDEHVGDRTSKRDANADAYRKERSMLNYDRKQLQNDVRDKKERDKRKIEKPDFSTEPPAVGSSRDLKNSLRHSNSETDNNTTRTKEKENAPSTRELVERMRKQGIKIKRMSAADFM